MVRHLFPHRLPSLRLAVSLAICALAGASTSQLAAQAATSTVVGVVTDEHGVPRPGTAVVATGESGSAATAHTDEAGTFRLLLAPGTHRLEIAGGAAGRRATAIQLLPGETTRFDAVVPSVEMAPPAAAQYRLSPATAFVLGQDSLAELPLDRADAAAAVLALAPGVARGSAFGTAAEIGVARRLDGLDLTDPYDGRAWTSFILPAATSASVRVGIDAGERDGSGAVLDVVTRAGGAALRGIVDVAGGGRGWSRETLPDEMLAANPGLADRDRLGRSLRAAAVLSGPLTPQLGFGLAVEYADEAGAAPRAGVSRTPRVHGRLLWGSGERAANVVGFVDRVSTTGDVPVAVRATAAPGLENERTSRTVASRATWQSPLRGAMRFSASLDVLRGTRTTQPTSDAAARRDEVTGAVTTSLGLMRAGERTRTIAGAAVDWRTVRMGGHDVRIGGDVERTQVTERAAFTAGELFHDLAGRADTVEVWSGSDRRTRLEREAIYVTDTWTPGRRLAIVAGVRAAHLRGGAYAATEMQPRVGATLAVDADARLVARASAGVVADPLLATHVDRAAGADTPVITFQILGDGRRVEIDRTTPTAAGVIAGIRHPQVREVTAGADFRLTRAVRVGGTMVMRRFLDAIDTVYPDARWLALRRPGLDGGTLSIYRWLNRRDGDAPMISNVDGTIYRAADNQPLGVAAAGRDYSGITGQAQITLPRDGGSLVVAVTAARSRGTLDDTYDAGIGRSDRFASPTAALTHVEGPSTLTPNLAITVYGSTRVPLVPIRVSAIYQRWSGAHYAARRTFAAATLNLPVDAEGRTAFLEPRGSRVLEPVGDLSLRLASRLPLGRRRPLEVYADIYNALRGQAVTAVETTSPFGASTGRPLAFETPIDVQRPFRLVAGGRLTF
jgi:hypothetical protein